MKPFNTSYLNTQHTEPVDHRHDTVALHTSHQRQGVLLTSTMAAASFTAEQA